MKQGNPGIPALRAKADRIRGEIVDVCVKNGAGHIAPSLSCVDILVALYYRVLRRSSDPRWEGRDRLVFSKGHGAYGLYAILADIGLLPRRDWEAFYRGGPLSGCVERAVDHGIEAGCGSLGHGLPQAVGIAFAAKLRGRSYRTYCVVGDGEMQEGSNWEALQFAAKHRLAALTVIVDANGLQAMDRLSNILSPRDSVSDLVGKIEAFGARARACDGHDIKELVSLLEAGSSGVRPRAIVARTVKGYGLRCMEGVPKFHFRIPTPKELRMGKRFP
jgi:transketolase